MIRINLLPQRRRRRRLIPESGVVAVTLAVIGALVASYSYYGIRNHQVQAQTERINREIAAIQPTVAEVLALEAQIEDMRAKETLLRALEARQLPWAEMLTDLARRTPPDAWLASAAVTGSEGTATRLTLSGSAMSYNAVARFMINLAASPFYAEVDLQAAQSNVSQSASVVQFGLYTTVRPAQAAVQGGAR
jgi:Tfp pilus assembly protein PilN